MTNDTLKVYLSETDMLQDVIGEITAKRDRLREINADLLAALMKLRFAVSMGPLDIAASYGPDAHPDIALEDAARVAEIAIVKAQEGAS